MSGKGIVITAGGPVQLASVWATLATLRRHLNCTLPVQLWYNSSAELDDASRKTFQVRLTLQCCLSVADMDHDR